MHGLKFALAVSPTGLYVDNFVGATRGRGAVVHCPSASQGGVGGGDGVVAIAQSGVLIFAAEAAQLFYFFLGGIQGVCLDAAVTRVAQ